MAGSGVYSGACAVCMGLILGWGPRGWRANEDEQEVKRMHEGMREVIQ